MLVVLSSHKGGRTLSAEAHKKSDAIGLCVVGLGIGASSILTSIAANPFSKLVAGADIDPNVLSRFGKAFPEARIYNDIHAACRDPDIEAIWIATPTWLHAEHTMTAARYGKHVVVSKP